MKAGERRDWQALIARAKECAEMHYGYHRAHAEDSEEIRLAVKAAYVSGFLAGVQRVNARIER